MTTMDRIILCAGEIVATAILVFLGCMGCVTGIAGGSIPHEQISLTFGLAVMVSVQVSASVSDGFCPSKSKILTGTTSKHKQHTH